MRHPPENHFLEPTAVPVDALRFPDAPTLTFEGFRPEAFAILDRLRQHPHIGQYREEKAGIRTYLTEPFKRYRDDLVVNWVLPNRLAFETEKNVFSRLLKNDFGAGGCHHHMWMAFPRPGRRRLAEPQLWHSISPAGFTTGLFVGGQARSLLSIAKDRMVAKGEHFLALLNPLLEDPRTSFNLQMGTCNGKKRRQFAKPLASVPDDLNKAQELWVETLLPRALVVRWQGALVTQALRGIHAVWPLYRFLFESPTPA